MEQVGTLSNNSFANLFSYKFVLVLKKGSRQKKASIDVIVKSGSPPMVQIFPPAVEKVNPTDVLIIESLIISKKTINATWMCVQSEGNLSTYCKELDKPPNIGPEINVV